MIVLINDFFDYHILISILVYKISLLRNWCHFTFYALKNAGKQMYLQRFGFLPN